MKDKEVYKLPINNIIHMTVKKAADEPSCGFPENTRVLKIQQRDGATKYIKAEKLLMRFQEEI